MPQTLATSSLLDDLGRNTKSSPSSARTQRFENHYDGEFANQSIRAPAHQCAYSRGWIEKFYRGTSLPAVHGNRKSDKKNKTDEEDDDENDDVNDDDDLGRPAD